jgi:hypothetical protein
MEEPGVGGHFNDHGIIFVEMFVPPGFQVVDLDLDGAIDLVPGGIDTHSHKVVFVDIEANISSRGWFRHSRIPSWVRMEVEAGSEALPKNFLGEPSHIQSSLRSFCVSHVRGFERAVKHSFGLDRFFVDHPISNHDWPKRPPPQGTFPLLA